MTRQEKISKGKLWQVYFDSKPDFILFEGTSRSNCLGFIRKVYNIRDYKNGKIRIANVIFEPENS